MLYTIHTYILVENVSKPLTRTDKKKWFCNKSHDMRFSTVIKMGLFYLLKKL